MAARDLVDIVVADAHFEVHLAFTNAADGDFARTLPASEVAPRRLAIAPGEMSWLHQVHGSDVVSVSYGEPVTDVQADALITAAPGMPLSVQTADCAPILMWGHNDYTPIVAAVHAGWKGLLAGVVSAAVDSMRSFGAEEVQWRLGPCISPQRYEFGQRDLKRLASRFGPTVESETDNGAPAFDLRAAVFQAMGDSGVDVAANRVDPPCTATDTDFFSHRARLDAGRQLGVIWFNRSESS